ncbi:nucleotidyltransferase family protein [Sphingomonas sp. So64.6b]|uniref:nucleotidyltransferase domain-containing protein n=1 Tax=Sphingomonas sp. So64.6b TaxID=2997354 RepID=UPI0015FF8441|nr:nucleotidyltransferase family protein [Sphingomonas sp. So64.6b]QNA82823.1 nucleotidyltransferase family protein [Sphingomonas sp. So64.6b]
MRGKTITRSPVATISPEMRLVAACCRWPATPARDAAVRAAAGDVDWPRFLKLVGRHRVIGLAYAGLSSAGVTLPGNGARWLMTRVAQMAEQNRILGAESARLQSLLDAAGIPSLLVKGAPLAELAYGSLAIKHAKDIDLLVRPVDLAAALALVRGDGYELWLPARELTERQLGDVMRHSRDIALINPDRHVQLELHWGLTDNPRMLAGLGATAETQAVTLGQGGPSVRTLARDDLFAYLCVHGAAHGWIRLKWLADVAALAAQLPEVEIERLYRASVERGVGHCAAQALLLSQALLGLTLPAALADELAASRRVRKLVAVALDIMTGPGAEAEIADRRFGQARLIRARFLLSRDWRDLGVNLVTHMTALEDVLAVPLPSRLHLLYPVLRVPLWIGRRAGVIGRTKKEGRAV